MNPSLQKILKKVTERSQPFFTSSNGILLTPQVSRMLAESSLYHIQISVDSPVKNTLKWIRRGANFERIIQGVKNLVQARKEAGRKFLITFHAIVMRENVQDLPELVRFAKSLDVAGVTACHLFVHDITDPASSCFWNQTEYDEMREKAIETACEIGSFYYGPPSFSETSHSHASTSCFYPAKGVYINPDGTVAPCCVAPRDIPGDLNRNSFSEIWNGKKYQLLRKTYNTNSPSVPHCKDCLAISGVSNQWKSYFSPFHWNNIEKILRGSEKQI